MATLSLRLSAQLDARLTEESRARAVPKSLLAREALEEYVARSRRERRLAELTRAAGALDPAEAATLAAEALPLDNEALGDEEHGENTLDELGDG